MIDIRVATKRDLDTVRAVHLSAFPEGEKRIVAALAVDLLGEAASPETISLVAEADGEVVAHAAFSPVTAEGAAWWKGFILAPLGVKPEYQKRGVGSMLVRDGIKRLAAMGVNVLFVYGDPDYYRRFGFDADTATGYAPPFEIRYPSGWQAVTLNECGFAELPVKISCVAALNDPELWY